MRGPDDDEVDDAMIRRLFTIVSALSMLLCVATLALCGRSHWWADGFDLSERGRIERPPGAWRWCAHGESARGKLLVVLYRESAYGDWGTYLLVDPCAEPYRAWFSRPAEAGQPYADEAGTGGFLYRRELGPAWHVRVGIPHWALAAAFLLPPGVWARRAGRHRRLRRTGHCPACGYDLRATPGRCPVCGNMHTAYEKLSV